MRSSQRLLAVLLFAAVSLLALACSGFLDWVSSSLFLVLEFLAEFLRRVFALRQPPRPHAQPARHRPAPAPAAHRPRRLAHRKGPPGRKRAARADDPAAQPQTQPTPKVRLLLPLSADRPELIGFALEECRARKAELVLLFLRPLAVTPMGPNPLPSASEDAAALTLFARVGAEAREAGVPLLTLYEHTHDRPASILEVAHNHRADLLLMEANRRNRFWTALAGDPTRAVLAQLPAHVSLIVHAA